MREFAFDSDLRSEVKVNGVGEWLLAELKKAYSSLGDLSVKPYWQNLTYYCSRRHTVANSLLTFLSSAEYVWFIYEGLGKGVSLGTLQLVRSAVDDVINQLNDVAWQIEEVSRQSSNIIAFFRCLELKPEISMPEEPMPYVSTAAGMKIEARDIHYKYNSTDKDEILKGASFLIEPGKMVAIVGYHRIIKK